MKFEVPLMLKKHEIEIELLSREKNEFKELKIAYNKVQEENEELKKRIENLELEIK